MRFIKKTLKKKREIIKKIKEKNTKPRVTFICPVCQTQLMVTKNEFKRKKYCSRVCRNKIINKKNNGQRSFAEVFLEKNLKESYPNLKIIFNDRTLLNGLELDVYIPSINMAIEWNGIYHYREIRDNDLLEKTKEKDNRKLSECCRLGVYLYVVKDLTSNKKFIKEETEKIINLVKSKIIK